MPDEWCLLSTNLARLRERRIEVAVLPLAATEPHNLHLPEGQDVLHTTWVARRACELAWAQSPAVICLPTLPFGVDCNLMAFPLAISVTQATLDAMVREIIASLKAHGIHKVVLVNGHGGNNFTPLVRQVQVDLGVHVFLCNWWQVGMDQYDAIFARRDDHAGEMETSVALALFPEQVELERARSGEAAAFRFEALRKGWVWTSRDFSRLNDHCAVGDPRAASAEKGRQYLDLVCGRLSAFLTELAATPVDDQFPMQNAPES